MKRIFAFAAVLGLFSVSATTAGAAWGLRGGVTFEPDQVHVGAHLEAGELFTNGVFLPNIEVGFGDDMTLFAFNPELVYRFTTRSNSGWGFYIGAGLGVNFVQWDEDWRGRDESDTDLGLNILGGMSRGLSSGNEFFLELKLGVSDSPDAKITAGLTFF